MTREDEEHLINGLESLIDIVAAFQKNFALLESIVTKLDARITKLERPDVMSRS